MISKNTNKNGVKLLAVFAVMAVVLVGMVEAPTFADAHDYTEATATGSGDRITIESGDGSSSLYINGNVTADVTGKDNSYSVAMNGYVNAGAEIPDRNSNLNDQFGFNSYAPVGIYVIRLPGFGHLPGCSSDDDAVQIKITSQWDRLYAEGDHGGYSVSKGERTFVLGMGDYNHDHEIASAIPVDGSSVRITVQVGKMISGEFSATSTEILTYNLDFSKVSTLVTLGDNPVSYPNIGTNNSSMVAEAKGWTYGNKILTFDDGYEGNYIFKANGGLTVQLKGKSTINSYAPDMRSEVTMAEEFGAIHVYQGELVIVPADGAKDAELTVNAVNPGSFGISAVGKSAGGSMSIGSMESTVVTSVTVTGEPNRALYTNGNAQNNPEGMAIQNSEVSVIGQEVPIRVHGDSGKDPHLTITKSTVDVAIVAGNPNGNGDDDIFGIKSNGLVDVNNSTINTEGLRAKAGIELDTASVVNVMGGYSQNPGAKLGYPVAGLYVDTTGESLVNEVKRSDASSRVSGLYIIGEADVFGMNVVNSEGEAEAVIGSVELEEGDITTEKIKDAIAGTGDVEEVGAVESEKTTSVQINGGFGGKEVDAKAIADLAGADGVTKGLKTIIINNTDSIAMTVLNSGEVDVAGVTLVLVNASINGTYKNGTSDSATFDITGTVTISKGSVSITGTDLEGTISNVAGVVDVSGVTSDDLTVTGVNDRAEAVLSISIKDAESLVLSTITASGTVTLGVGSSIKIGDYTYKVITGDTDSRSDVLTIVDNAVSVNLDVGDTLEVIKGGDAVRYTVSAKEGEIGTSVMMTLFGGKIAGDVFIEDDTVLTVTDRPDSGKADFEISKGNKVTVNGKLVADKVVIDEGAKLNVAGTVVATSGIVNEGTINLTRSTAILTSSTDTDTSFNAVISGDGVIDASGIQAEGTLQSGNIVSTATVKFYQHYTAEKNATFKEGANLEVFGELIINEGVTITIEEGSKFIVNGGQAKIINNGTIILNGYAEGGVLSSTSFGSIENGTAGKIVASADAIATGNVIQIAGKLVNAGTITIGEYSDIALGDGADVRNSGELSVEGTIAATGQCKFINTGEVVFEGVIGSGVRVLNASANAIISFTGASAVGTSKAVTVETAIEKVGSKKIASVNQSSVLITVPAGDVFSGLIVGATTKDITTTTDTDKVYAGVITLDGILSVAKADGSEYSAETPVMTVSVNGYSQIAGQMTVGANVALSINNAEISGNIVVAEKAVATFAGKVSVSGTVVINGGANASGVPSYGKLTLADSSETIVSGSITAMYTGGIVAPESGTAKLAVTGKVTVVSSALGPSIVYSGAVYKVSKDPAVTGSVDKYVYTSLATAVADGATDITLKGAFDVKDSVSVVSGTTVTVDSGAEVEIKADAIVTFAAGSVLKNAGEIKSEGALVIDTTRSTLKNTGSIVSVVVLTDGEKTTYSGITYALGIAVSGSTVKVSEEYDGNIEVSAATVIPAGVVLDTNAHKVVVKKNAVLTVDGTLFLNGTASTLTLDPKGADTDKDGSIVLNGVIKSDKALAYTDKISGAYFAVEENTDTFYFISTVAYAAGISNTVYKGEIAIHGQQTLGDIAFAGTKDLAVKVVLNGNTTASSVTLSYATLSVKDGATFAGTVKTVVGDVVLSGKAGAGFVIADAVPSTGETMTVSGKFILTENGKITGTFVVNDKVILKDLTVEKVTVDGSATVKGTASIDEIIVNGDVSVDNAAVLNVKRATVLGALDAVAATTTATAGSVNVDGKLFVGITEKAAIGEVTATTTAAGVSVTGTVSFVGESYAVIAAGSTIPEVWTATTSTLKNTVYSIDDAEYVTVYVPAAYTTLAITTIVCPEIENAEVTSWKNSEGTVAKPYVAAVGDTSASEPVGFVGASDWTKVSGKVNTKIYKVTITTDGGIGYITIDGNLMTAGSNGNVFSMDKLVAGEHTIAFAPAAGYDTSNVVLKDSDGKVVSGMKIVLSGTEDEDRSVSYQLVGSTAAADTPIIIEPSQPAEKDDEMGLTEYLLIVLVVLAAILVVVVAIRMMRS